MLLADDHAGVRKNLGALLRADGHFTVVGEAKNGLEAVELAGLIAPDLILLDISMPMLNGLQAARQILAARAGAKVIILSAYDDEEYIARARALGVAGFLSKQLAAGALAKAILAIVVGACPFKAAPGRRSPPNAAAGTARRAGPKARGEGPVGQIEPTVQLKII